MNGRTFDIAVFHGESATQPQRIALTGPDRQSRLITGARKLAQRVLWLLLTVRGSVLGKPELGTALLLQAQRGEWRTQADVQESFASARFDLLRQLEQETPPDAPPDERLEDLQLQRVVLRPDGVALHLVLTTQAGERRELFAPVPETLAYEPSGTS